MKFTGQVRVPEVDHPGVPATIVVEAGQTEVFLEGESLGRWSLFDVHASRLVSSAFSLSLGGEEITFIADEPVDFAYKGVDHMAETWARYKAMTIPRRVVAVGRSRRGTLPSRIAELRDAMLQNLESVGHGSARLVPSEPLAEMPEPAPWRSIDAYSKVPEPLDTEPPAPEPVVDEAVLESEPVDEGDLETESVMDQVDPPTTESASLALETAPHALEAAPLAPEAREETPPAPSRPLRPGPGLIPRKVEPQTRFETPDQEPPRDEPPPYEEVVSDADPEYIAAELEPPLPDPPVIEAETGAGADGDEPIDADQATIHPEVPDEVDEADAVPEVDGETEALPEVDEGPRPEVVVDLAPLEEVEDAGPSIGEPELDPLQPDLELLFAGAPAPAGERSGLLGAVRSAFARNKTVHHHEFVEAPGGIGIVRQICAECGYISIGVSD